MRLKCNLFKIKIFTVVLVLTLAISGQISAQQRTIEGTVTDNQGSPLPGVTVVVKGTTQGTVTNADGNYSLSNIPDDATLVFSFVGMRTTEIEVKNQTLINVTLEQETIGIDEVVAIGYGTVKKSDLTGSVQRVNIDNFQNQRSTNIVEVLSGTMAGVNSNQGTSASGGGSLEIRGPNSLKASTSPLIILDGVVYMGVLDDIHPEDIESIDVLKDASSAAIFGAQSASGVLIITTKRGKKGKPTLNFSSKVGIVGLTNIVRSFGPDEYPLARGANFSQENPNRPKYYYTNPENLPDNISVDEWINYGQGTGNPTEIWLNRLAFNSIEIENYLAGNTIDWFDEIFRNGIQQDYDVSMAGGTDDLQYFLSAGYTDNEGYVVGDDYTNFRSRVNIDGNITKFLKVGVNAQFANRDDSSVPASRTGAENQSPYGSKYNDDGTLRMYPMEDIFVNPLMYTYLRDYLYKTQTLFATLFGELKLPWGISYRINYSNNMIWRKVYLFDPIETPRGMTNEGYGSRMSRSTYGWQVDNILKWNKTIAEIHKFDLTFVANAEKRQSWEEQQTNIQFAPTDALGYHAMQAGSTPNINSNDTYQTGNAIMGRINYSLLNRYLFTFTMRRDGYSAFGQKHPYATFPSAAFAWRISEENFFKTSLINDLKLRLSWGETGNRSIGIYDALARLATTRYLYGDNLVTGVYSNTMANEDLRWESTAALNLGLDFGLFQNRLYGSIDLYQMTTTDLLLDRSLPGIIGYSSVAANLGELENKGFELTINSTNINIQDKFRWNTSLNFSFNRNKIKNLYGDMIDVLDESGNVIGQKEADDWTNGWFIGESIDRIWEYENIGVWQMDEAEEAAIYGKSPGDYKLRDVNDDGVLTPEDDKIFLGYSKPQYRLGLRNDLIFLKNFEFSVFMRADLAFLRQNQLYGAAMGQEGSDHWIHRRNIYARPYWTEENPSNEWARLTSNIYGPGFITYKNSSFLRIQDISLSYNFPSEKIQSFSLQNLRLYVNLRNYFTFTKWNYWDPESGSSPMPKYFTFGINASI